MRRVSLCGASECIGTKRCLACHSIYMKAWRKGHPDPYNDAVKARKRVAMRVRRGTMAKLPCELCGVVPVEAHHEDYSRPLDVQWLCRPHHLEADRERRSRI